MDEREVRFSHGCYAPADDCQNPMESYGMVCVQCGRCGREFKAGVLVGKRTETRHGEPGRRGRGWSCAILSECKEG